MPVGKVRIRCYGGAEQATATVDLGSSRTFLAWMSFGYINPWNGNFDSDNGIVAEVYSVDGVRVPYDTFGGEHLGPEGALTNMHQITHVGFGRRVTFRLRAFHASDLELAADGLVLTNI
jgi:hypothetical protein